MSYNIYPDDNNSKHDMGIYIWLPSGKLSNIAIENNVPLRSLIYPRNVIFYSYITYTPSLSYNTYPTINIPIALWDIRPMLRPWARSEAPQLFRGLQQGITQRTHLCLALRHGRALRGEGDDQQLLHLILSEAMGNLGDFTSNEQMVFFDMNRIG